MTRGTLYPADERFVALAEIQAAALRALPPEAAVFLESGAGAERTLRSNREAFGRWTITPTPMSGVSAPRTSTAVLGIPLSVPVLTAQFGGDGMFGADGHPAVARGTAACGTASIVPELGTFCYEEVRAAAPAAARIAQVHPYESFGHVAKRVRAAGYEVLCVTVDCPMTGFRTRARMTRYHPDRAIWGNVRRDGATARRARRACSATASASTRRRGPGTSSPRRPPARTCRGSRKASSPPRRPAPPSAPARRRSTCPTTAAARSTPPRRAWTSSLELLTEELRALMILAGTPDIASITTASVAHC